MGDEAGAGKVLLGKRVWSNTPTAKGVGNLFWDQETM